MSIELDLVHDYLAGDDGLTAGDLTNARAILDAAIDEGIPEMGASAGRRTGKGAGNLRKHLWVASAVGAVAAVTAVAVLTTGSNPTRRVHRSLTASAQLARLADAVQPPPPLQPGQWATEQMSGELSASVIQVGNTPTPNAQASVPLTLRLWSNSTGTTCTSQAFGTATFATPANAAAWQALGLVATPSNQPVTGCVAGQEVTNGSSSTLTPIDVTTLTTNPATLAQELQDGTTGIPIVDTTQRGATAQQNAFERLVLLLVGPTSGAPSAFDQELLHAMALIPDVRSLGPMTTHSGQTGLGFTAATAAVVNPTNGRVVGESTSPVVVLSASGSLLEARGFSIPYLGQAAQDFVGSPSASIYSQGGGYGVQTKWIDPAGQPAVVQQGSLPSWVTSFHLVEAVTNANALSPAISSAIDPFLGNGNISSGFDNVPAQGQTTLDISIANPQTSVSSIVAALNATGLFQSVVVKA